MGMSLSEGFDHDISPSPTRYIRQSMGLISASFTGPPRQLGWHSPGQPLIYQCGIWIMRTGAPWRDLPPDLGGWSNTHRRFIRCYHTLTFNDLANDRPINTDSFGKHAGFDV